METTTHPVKPIHDDNTADFEASERLMNAAAMLINEARALLKRDDVLDAVWRDVVQQRERIVNSMHRFIRERQEAAGTEAGAP